MMVMMTRMVIMMMTMTMMTRMMMVMETMTFFHTRHVAMSRKMRQSRTLPNGRCDRRGHCPGKCERCVRPCSSSLTSTLPIVDVRDRMPRSLTSNFHHSRGSVIACHLSRVVFWTYALGWSMPCPRESFLRSVWTIDNASVLPCGLALYSEHHDNRALWST